jgi:hypothetical protein
MVYHIRTYYPDMPTWTDKKCSELLERIENITLGRNFEGDANAVVHALSTMTDAQKVRFSGTIAKFLSDVIGGVFSELRTQLQYPKHLLAEKLNPEHTRKISTIYNIFKDLEWSRDSVETFVEARIGQLSIMECGRQAMIKMGLFCHCLVVGYVTMEDIRWTTSSC